jgi:hypothetical protein
MKRRFFSAKKQKNEDFTTETAYWIHYLTTNDTNFTNDYRPMNHSFNKSASSDYRFVKFVPFVVA